METIRSLLAVVLVLAAVIAPQALAVYFSTWRKSEREEFIPDGR